ncbi:MAG: hypothetical protein ABI588_10150 [Arenimonas sp.]
MLLQLDLAAVDDRHAGAIRAHVLGAAGCQHDDAAFAELAQQSEYAPAFSRVESFGWLIRQQQQGIAQKHYRNCEALLHSTREAAQDLPARIPKAGAVK